MVALLLPVALLPVVVPLPVVALPGVLLPAVVALPVLLPVLLLVTPLPVAALPLPLPVPALPLPVLPLPPLPVPAPPVPPPLPPPLVAITKAAGAGKADTEVAAVAVPLAAIMPTANTAVIRLFFSVFILGFRPTCRGYHLPGVPQSGGGGDLGCIL
jgi:signal-induced proliferation-associated 1 like protein 3